MKNVCLTLYLADINNQKRDNDQNQRSNDGVYMKSITPIEIMIT